jgi:hypothetical protein
LVLCWRVRDWSPQGDRVVPATQCITNGLASGDWIDPSRAAWIIFVIQGEEHLRRILKSSA